MYISHQLKEQNIAEYLLYMWQIEDVIRACGLNIDRIKACMIDTVREMTDEQKQATLSWYGELIDMMHQEGVTSSGHLQINKNIIVWLTDLHLRLLASPKFPEYSAQYYKVLPYIVEIRAKGGKKELPEVENCFDMLYGVMLLRVQHKPLSEATEQATKEVSRFIAMLAAYYKKDKQGELEE